MGNADPQEIINLVEQGLRDIANGDLVDDDDVWTDIDDLLRSTTDWKKLRDMADDEIRFTADAPQTTAEDWAEAVAHRGLPPVPRPK